MAIDHLKEQGIEVEFDLQIVFTPHFCSVVHGLNQEQLAKMDNAVMQSQGILLRDVNHSLPAVMESCSQSKGEKNEEPDHLPQDHACGG